MFDCGIDDQCSAHIFDKIMNAMRDVDILLLTHSSFKNIGALPYVKKMLGEGDLSIYSTFPISKLALITMYEFYQSKKAEGDFDYFDLTDIDSAFESIETLNFN